MYHYHQTSECLFLQPVLGNIGGDSTAAISLAISLVQRELDRDIGGHPAPRAQIPACTTNALDSCLRLWRQSGAKDSHGAFETAGKSDSTIGQISPMLCVLVLYVLVLN